MKLKLVIVSVAVLVILAYGALQGYVIDPKTVSSTEDLLELFYQCRESLPPLPSPVNYGDVMEQLADGRVDFIASPNWAYNHDGGTFYLSDDSELAKTLQLPASLLAYEDLASGKVVLACTPVATEKLQVLAIEYAPEFAPFTESTSVESYLMAELWPRRVIWSATLKPEAGAWGDLVQAEQATSMSAVPMMMSMSLPASPTNLIVAINSTNTNSVVEIEIGYPVTFTNRVEIYATTNLVDGEWTIVSSALATTGSTTVVWTDTQTNFQFRAYRVGNADLDSDGDGLVDAREVLLYKTDRFSSDSDGDFMGDAWELQYSLDPNDDLDMILDPDHDMLPNVYEQYYGLNPNSSDSSSITKLLVDPANASQSNTFSSIQAAFNASTNYSIIEIAPGFYKGGSNVGLDFPDHPVMLMSDNWGTNRTVEIKSSGFAAFFLNGQDNRTIIRGLNIKQTLGRRIMQNGFYLGHGSGPFNGAAPYFDGVKIDLCDADWAVGFYGLGSTEKTVRFNNCIIRGADGDHVSSGIYLVDSPKVHVANCSFLNFNTSTNVSHGILFGTSSINLGNAPASIDVRVGNCFWDESFATNGNYAVAHAAGSVDRYSTEVLSAIVPNTAYLLSVDSMAGVTETNGVAIRDGLILSNSPCINASSVDPLSWYDFHGQSRDASPDLGADEFGFISTDDTDGDGLSDYAEAFTNFTSIFDYDSDEDGVGDGDEVTYGTSPTNIDNYCVIIAVEVDNQSGLSSAVRASYALGSSVWNATNAVTVTGGQFTYGNQYINSTEPLNVMVLIDLDGDGQPDTGEPYYRKPLNITNHTSGISFLLKDADGDGVADGDEVYCETDPNDAQHYCVTLQGTVSNLTRCSGTIYASAVLLDGMMPPRPDEADFQGKVYSNLAMVVVNSNNSFMIEDLKIDLRSNTNSLSLWLEIFQDISTNGTIDYFEPMEQIQVIVTNHTMSYQPQLQFNSIDADEDGIPDGWEMYNGLSYTNAADAFADPDGDWIDNLWEYRLGTDLYTYDTNNYAFADAMQAVDSRIDGLVPTNAIHIFSEEYWVSTNLVRNPNCWAADIDLTCCSPWNSQSKNKRAGTLISPRHVLLAAHFDEIPTGHVLKFVDINGDIVERTLVRKKQHPNYESNSYPDFTVGLLNMDVSTNLISFAKVLPDEYEDYLGDGKGIPVICLDQEEKAIVANINDLHRGAGNDRYYTGVQFVSAGTREHYSDGGLVLHDSGNPCFIVINQEPILLTVWTSGNEVSGSGSTVTKYRDDINDIMLILDQEYGNSNTYELEEVDLTIFTLITNGW